MLERLTVRARRALVLAQEEALRLNHAYVGTEHVLLGLIRERDGLAAMALQSLGISLEDARDKVEEAIVPSGTALTGSSPFTLRAKRVLELARRESLQLGQNYVGTEHILLGIAREGDGVAAQVLAQLGVDLSRVRQRVVQLLTGYLGKEPSLGAGAVPIGSWSLTPRAREVLELALRESLQRGNFFLRSEHALLGLLAVNGGLAARALESLGVSLDDARRRAEERMGPTVPFAAPYELPLRMSDEAGVLQFAVRDARELGQEYVGTGHILLSVLRDEEGGGALVLVELGLELSAIRERVIQLMQEVEREDAEPGPRTDPRVATGDRSPEIRAQAWRASEPGSWVPRCPACWREISSLRLRSLELETEGRERAPGGPLSVAACCCRACGAVIAIRWDR
jgi:ATP-dependent Clp protease ATP-binding subunit ClpA